MRTVVTALAKGLGSGRFVEETLEALCMALGASTTWCTLDLKADGRVFRARRGNRDEVNPAELQRGATHLMREVLSQRRALSGSVPEYPTRCMVSVPLWSPPSDVWPEKRLVGALCVDFTDESKTTGATTEFLECIAGLLGGVIAQQALLDSTQENLRAQRANETIRPTLGLDELLAPESMTHIRQEVRAALAGNASMMILGESGTGKTQIATAIARATPKKPVVRATLGFSDDLNTITSELFGHERGAFSGAVSKRKGLVEFAHGGTLILDEVLNLPSHAQQLLLDFTQFGTYRPLGYQAQEPKHAKVRLISVTNGNIAQAVADTRFRQDLYFRLATVPLTLPPLRERRADIPTIAVRYLRRTDPQHDWTLDEDAKALLSAPHLPWAGNIRELESIMERARNRLLAVGEQCSVIRVNHLDLPSQSASRPPRPISIRPARQAVAGMDTRDRWKQLVEQRAELNALEKDLIEEALTMHEGVVAKAARELCVPRTGLISRMAKLDVDAPKSTAERGR
jgi:transcriptional regulator with GAF, ATPase, and Fis domain